LPNGNGRVCGSGKRSTQAWNSPGVSPVSLPSSKVVTTTTRTGSLPESSALTRAIPKQLTSMHSTNELWAKVSLIGDISLIHQLCMNFERRGAPAPFKLELPRVLRYREDLYERSP